MRHKWEAFLALTMLFLLLSFAAFPAFAEEGFITEPTEDSPNYDVSIGWDGMTFEYKTKWNPETHSYEPWAANGGKVYVTNTSDSNAPVMVTLSFSPQTDVNAMLIQPYDMANEYEQLDNGLRFMLPYEDDSGEQHNTAIVDMMLYGNSALPFSDDSIAGYAGMISVSFTPLPFIQESTPMPEFSLEPEPTLALEPTLAPEPSFTPEPTLAPDMESVLRDTLAAGGTAVLASDIMLEHDLVIPGDAVLDTGMFTLMVSEGATLTVEAGGCLRVAGTLINAGVIDTAGEVMFTDTALFDPMWSNPIIVLDGGLVLGSTHIVMPEATPTPMISPSPVPILTPVPTHTPVPTLTPEHTPTPDPTLVPEPMLTPEPASTPMPTPEPIPVPTTTPHSALNSSETETDGAEENK